MNPISVVFITDNIFIIHVFGDIYNDQDLVYLIKTTIQFNKEISIFHTKSIKHYKGIVIFKKIENFNCEYILADVYIKHRGISGLSISGDEINSIKMDDFMSYLHNELKSFIFDNNILYYNSEYNGENYIYEYSPKTILDLNILTHSFSQIINKEYIDYIEFDIRI